MSEAFGCIGTDLDHIELIPEVAEFGATTLKVWQGDPVIAYVRPGSLTDRIDLFQRYAKADPTLFFLDPFGAGQRRVAPGQVGNPARAEHAGCTCCPDIHLIPVGPGTADIEFNYRRPWLKDQPPARSYKLRVVVRDAP